MGFVGHVAANRRSAAAQLLDRRLDASGLQVGDNDRTAFFNEQLRGGESDAAGAARDNPDLALESSRHGGLLPEPVHKDQFFFADAFVQRLANFRKVDMASHCGASALHVLHVTHFPEIGDGIVRAGRVNETAMQLPAVCLENGKHLQQGLLQLGQFSRHGTDRSLHVYGHCVSPLAVLGYVPAAFCGPNFPCPAGPVNQNVYNQWGK
jgi:hypothetical protein